MAVCGDEINPLRLESKRLPFLPLHVDFRVWDIGEIPICMRYILTRTSAFTPTADRMETFPADGRERVNAC